MQIGNPPAEYNIYSPYLHLSPTLSILFIVYPPTNQARPKIVFPKIAIKSSDGPVIVREREKILDEKIVRRTEEVACPITGRPQLRTVEYIEKIIETEVRASKSNSNQQLPYCTYQLAPF